MSHIYICYSRPNKSYADYLADDLRRRGFDVWIDERTNLDKQHLLKIVQAIQECDAFVLVYSAIAEESNLVQRETDFALQNDKPFFTLMLEGEAEGADSYDVADGSLPPAEFYDSLKHYAPVKTDTVTADDLFEEDEDLFGALDIDSIEPIVRDDELLSFDEFDMDDLLDDGPTSKEGQQGGKRRRGRLLLGGVGLIILLLLLAVVAVILGQDDDEPKVADNTVVPTATDVPTEAPTLEPSETPQPVATDTPVPTETQIPFWLQPVSANEDWEIVVQEFDGVAMVLVPSGCFRMGSTDTDVDALEDEQPAHEICFDEPFWIDQYEISNSQLASFGFPARASALPTDIFTWVLARNYCGERSARLPTEAEWEYAARGPDSLQFAFGNEFDDTLVVSAESEDTLPQEGGSRGESSVSWVGTYDMNGNVWEWTSTIYLPYPYVADDAHENDVDEESARVLRGGALDNTMSEVRNAVRRNHAPTERDAYFGARCARDFVEGDIAE